MRTIMIVIVVFLAVVFIGGVVNLGGVPLFQRVDTALGTDILMDLHYGMFFFLHSSERGYEKTRARVKQFEDKPIGIDNKRRYRQLDDASKQ